MWKIVRENYTAVHVLVLRELFAKNFLSVCILYTGCSYLILFLRATVLMPRNPTLEVRHPRCVGSITKNFVYYTYSQTQL